MDMRANILVGLANASPNYGIQPRGKLTAQILRDIWEIGVNRVDSARDYEFAEEVLAETKLNWRVQTKFKLPKVYDSFDDLLRAAKIAIENIEVECLLVHTPDLFQISRANQVVLDLKKISEVLEIPQVGISIYRPHELELLQDWQNLDVLQFPHNPLDTNCLDWLRLIRKGKFPKLQARSIYLQGLLISETSHNVNLPIRLSEILSAWEKWTIDLGINSQAYCATFAFGNLEIDEIVVGVDSAEQLRQLISNVVEPKDLPVYPKVIPAEFTDPRRWSY